MKTPQLPVPTLASALGLTTELYLKREDLHHSGSHKGRSIPLMIKEYARTGIRQFVISSSGNAALAAIIDVQHHNKNKPLDPLTLLVYTGEHLPLEKEQRLHEAARGCPDISLMKTTHPKQAAFQKSQAGYKLLRQSTDDLALRGYQELAMELAKIPTLSAIFVPTSSGTTAQGLFEGFKKLSIPLPQIHIVQTPTCHPLVTAVSKAQGLAIDTTEPSEPSLARSIVDHVAQRSAAVTQAVVASQGRGWIVSNTDIERIIMLVKKTLSFSISPTSAVGLAALEQCTKQGLTPPGTIAVLITGT